MLLRSLADYADRLELPPSLYAEGPVRYIIELDSEGRLLNPVPTDTADPSSPRTRRGFRRLVPQIQRSSAIRPLLLADKADYVLGFSSDEKGNQRAQLCHEAFLELVDRCAAETQEPAVLAVQRFLHAGPLKQLQLLDDFDPGGIITFRVNGIFPVDLPAVQEFWAQEHTPDKTSAPLMQCLVCGEERPVLPRLQGKIKGVPGGQPSGTSLISANADAFESYGLSASLTAPTCARCGERFTKAINALLADESSRLFLGGGAVCIYWTRHPVEFSLHTYLDDPQPADVAALLNSVRRGKRLPDIDDEAFYVTVLRGSGGRAVVRDWLDTTIGEVRRHLADWFERQAIICPDGQPPQPLGIFPLAASTVRDAGQDLSPATGRALLRSALAGTPLPYALLQAAVLRNRAEQRVTRPRAALIKLVLLSNDPTHKEEVMVQLEPESTSVGYQCGRLFAVLEEAQRAAIGTETLVSRFFGSASSAPASVFGRLLRGVQPHLAKLERDRPGAYNALQARLEDILSHIPAFPRTLSLEEQGLFALGYYHQRAHDREKARDAAERRRAGLTSAEETKLDTPDRN